MVDGGGGWVRFRSDERCELCGGGGAATAEAIKRSSIITAIHHIGSARSQHARRLIFGQLVAGFIWAIIKCSPGSYGCQINHSQYCRGEQHFDGLITYGEERNYQFPDADVC